MKTGWSTYFDALSEFLDETRYKAARLSLFRMSRNSDQGLLCLHLFWFHQDISGLILLFSTGPALPWMFAL